MARALTHPEGEEDISRWFWELGLTHARLSILETFEEVEPLPETDIPVLDVPDQAVEQMTRLISRFSASAAISGNMDSKTENPITLES